MGRRTRTIGLVGRNGEYAPLALDHAADAFVPALDDLANPENEIERFPRSREESNLTSVPKSVPVWRVQGQHIAVGTTDRCRGGITRTYVMDSNLMADLGLLD